MPQKFVNLENLTSFWGNAKEYIGNERKEIEDQLYNWQKTEKASIVQCEPVPNSELHPIVEFKFKETLPEGEKSPDNPSTIVGVSSIDIGNTGKNIYWIDPSNSVNNFKGVSVQFSEDGTITLNGTCNAANGTSQSSQFLCYNSNFKYYNSSTIKITCSVKHISGSFTLPDGVVCPVTQVQLTTSKGYLWFTEDGTDTSTVFTVSASQIHSPILKLYGGVTYNNYKIRVQYDIANEATIFEPSTLIYNTIQLGDTYYGGSVDIVTGLMTVTYYGETFTQCTNTWNNFDGHTQTSNTVSFQVNPQKSHALNYRIASNMFTIGNSNTGTNEFTHRGGVGVSTFKCSIAKNVLDLSGAVDPENLTTSETYSAVNSFLSTHPLFIVYEVATPFTIQLTPQQIKSLSSLEGTSKRINTIYTDADSVQVGYQKYVGIDSTLDSNSVNAIQNKVVNSALNTKVSLTGDETISGTKTFSNTINGNITGDAGTVAGHIVSKDVPVNAVFTDTTYDPATQSTAGLMSASDKIKLDAVGSVFTFKGSVIDDTYLPASDNVNGDAYLAEDTGHVHVYDGTSFVDIGVWAGIPSATDAQIDALFED